ncbi:cell division protein FtsA [bacterium]|nr:cell division protein FtsA [bacterium]
MLSNDNIINALDIGSSNIKLASARVDEQKNLHLIGIVEGPSTGINKGIITDIEDTVASISHCLDKAEKIIGLSLDHAFVAISGTHIISQDSRGVIAISHPDGEIKESDVERVLETAQTIATPPNYEIIHVIPRSFTVDNQPDIKDPVGMTGIRLEVNAQIILGLQSQIKNLRKCLYRVGIKDDELVFTPIASAQAVLNKRQKELGVAVIDIGDTTTSIIVFEEGDVLAIKVLPVGSRHITSDIAIGLRISMDLAEKIKMNYGSAIIDKISKHEIINLNELDKNETESVSRKTIVEIINARCEEIFKLVDNELKKIDRSRKLPAGVVLTGAGAKLSGLVNLAKKVLKLPAILGVPGGFQAVNKKFFDPKYATVIGLLLWGREMYLKPQKRINRFNFADLFKRYFKKILP